MPETILKTRVIAPSEPDKIVSRARLLSLMGRNSRASLTLIHGPAGYGKTTAALDFLYKNRKSFAWLQVSGDMRNFFTFMDYLAHCLRNLDSGFGSKTLELLNSFPKNESSSRAAGVNNVSKTVLAEITDTFINDLQDSFRDSTYIIIDDLENIIDAGWLTGFLDYFLKNIPQSINMIITSRVLPGIDYSCLNSKRKMLMIDQNDLNFSKTETVNLLKEVYELSADKDSIELLDKKLGGWITAIHLFLNAYGSGYRKVLKDSRLHPGGQSLENIYDLFANEYFGKLDNDLKEFLLVTSLTDSFDVSIANHLLDNSWGKKFIKELFRQNLFIQSRLIESNGKYSEEYFYHNLFRQFLNNKLNEEKTALYIRNLHKKMFEYYLNGNKVKDALKYGIRAGDYKRAVPLLIKSFRSIFDKGNYAELWDVINEIDKKILSSNPYLIYFKSLLERFYLNDPDTALSDIVRAISIFKKKKDEDYLVRCYVSKSRILLNKGRSPEVIKDLSSLLKKKLKKENQAKIYNHIALAYFLNSDLETSLEHLKKSLSALKETGDNNLKGWAYNLTGNIYLMRGEYTKAILQYEQAINKSPDIRTRFGTLCNLVLSYSQTGNHEKAGRHLEEIEETANRFPASSFRINSLISKQAFYFEQCRFHEAVKILEEMIGLALNLDRKYYLFLGYRLIADCYYYLDKFSTAGEYYSTAKKYIDSGNELETAELSNMKAILEKRESKAAKEKARTGLLNAYKFYNARNYYYNKAQAAFHLAGVNLELNNRESAVNYLSESLSLCLENEYIPFLERELLSSRMLFDFALREKVNRDLVKSVFEGLFTRLESLDPAEESAKRLKEKIDPLYDLKFYAFGIMEFKVRGRIIAEDQWIKKKRKIILAYLLLSSNNEITKDRLIEIFYPDTPVESVENIFHQTISKLRSLLAVGEDAKDKRKSSLLIYEDKTLKLDMDFNYYIDAFEFDRYYLKYSLHDLPADEKINMMKKAVDIYRGEFMEGHYETWIEDLRQDYNNKFISVCTDLVLTLKEDRKYNEVIKYSLKLLSFDGLNEDAYITLTEAYKMTGNLKAAREAVKTMEARFKKLLNEKPPEDLVHTVEEILSR